MDSIELFAKRALSATAAQEFSGRELQSHSTVASPLKLIVRFNNLLRYSLEILGGDLLSVERCAIEVRDLCRIHARLQHLETLASFLDSFMIRFVHWGYASALI